MPGTKQVLEVTLVKKTKKIFHRTHNSCKAKTEIIITQIIMLSSNVISTNKEEVLKSVRVSSRRT